MSSNTFQGQKSSSVDAPRSSWICVSVCRWSATCKRLMLHLWMSCCACFCFALLSLFYLFKLHNSHSGKRGKYKKKRTCIVNCVDVRVRAAKVFPTLWKWMKRNRVLYGPFRCCAIFPRGQGDPDANYKKRQLRCRWHNVVLLFFFFFFKSSHLLNNNQNAQIRLLINRTFVFVAILCNF